MPETDIGSAEIGNLEGTQDDFSVATATTDGATDQKETRYQNTKWTQQYGYFKKIPEVKSVIDAKAKWIMGKGFTSNPMTEIALGTFDGCGVDTFNSILKNQITVSEIGGDSFAEQIRVDESFTSKAKRFLRISDQNDGTLINLKPLNPESMVTIANRKGRIIRYEQMDLVTKKKIKSYKPGQMFHLMRDRIADEIHGTSMIDAVEDIILARNEAIADYKKLLHRNVYPVRIFHLDTDIPSEIAAFKAKADKASAQGENIYIPKGAVETELSSVATNSTLNPLPWINMLTQNFYQESGVPQIIVGGAQEITEASGKIAYLSWEQTIEDKQLYVEEQVLMQLNLDINLEFPASLQNELLSDNRKDKETGATSPEDTTATV